MIIYRIKSNENSKNALFEHIFRNSLKAIRYIFLVTDLKNFKIRLLNLIKKYFANGLNLLF